MFPELTAMAVYVTLLTLLPIALLPLAHLIYASWVRRRFPVSGDVELCGGARVHFTRSGGGPPVVLVHGANGTRSDFSSELLLNLARDHSVFALDRPGHGWSDAHAGPLGLRENVAALLAFMRMQRLAGATVVGHSYGAAVALAAALEAPELVAHVVAVTPCTVIDRRNARYAAPAWVVGRAGQALFHFVSLLFLPFALQLRSQAWHPERAPRGWNASRAFAYVPSQMHASARNFHSLHADLAWLADHLPGFRSRLTVLAGAADQVTPPEHHVEWLTRVIPSARIEVLPRTGHWLPRLRPDLVAEAVRSGILAQSPQHSGR